jgi:predicted TPR repeat methyltransferase
MSADEPGQDAVVNFSELTIDQAFALADMLIRKNELEDAAAVYRRILDAAPEHPDALNFLAILTYHQKDYEKALDYVRRAAAGAPEHAGIQNNLGNMLVEAGDVEGAVEAYNRSVQLDPSQPEPLNNLGSIHKARGEYDDAERLLRQALSLNPKHGPAHHNLGEVLIRTGRPQSAIDHFWQAVAFMPSHQFNPYFIAMAYDRIGKRDEAITVLTEWLQKDPGNIEVKHLLPGFTGEEVPDRASDQFVERVFDRFAGSFEAQLKRLDYQAPQLVGAALEAAVGPPRGELMVLDAGCGTGLCGPLLRRHAERLCGVDLSAGMLEKAAKTKLYDELQRAELTEFLASKDGVYDAVVSADTLCYFGSLEGFAAAAARALAPGGVLVFTVEALPPDRAGSFFLAVTGRYQHSGPYVDRVLEGAGFEITARDTATLRLENLEPVAGFVVTATRT